MMDAIIFGYLICLTVSEGLNLRLMDVITTYLHGYLNSDIYMKILKGFQMPEFCNCSIYSIKLQRSLYRLNNPKACGTITSMDI